MEKKIVFYVIGSTVALKMLAAVLPKLIGPVTILVALAVVARLVWFFTQRW